MYFENGRYVICLDGFDVVCAIDKLRMKFTTVDYTRINMKSYRPIKRSIYEQIFNSVKYLESNKPIK